MKLPHWGPLQSVIWWMVLRVFDVEAVGALQLLDCSIFATIKPTILYSYSALEKRKIGSGNVEEGSQS